MENTSRENTNTREGIVWHFGIFASSRELEKKIDVSLYTYTHVCTVNMKLQTAASSTMIPGGNKKKTYRQELY